MDILEEYKKYFKKKDKERVLNESERRFLNPILKTMDKHRKNFHKMMLQPYENQYEVKYFLNEEITKVVNEKNLPELTKKLNDSYISFTVTHL